MLSIIGFNGINDSLINQIPPEMTDVKIYVLNNKSPKYARFINFSMGGWPNNNNPLFQLCFSELDDSLFTFVVNENIVFPPNSFSLILDFIKDTEADLIILPTKRNNSLLYKNIPFEDFGSNYSFIFKNKYKVSFKSGIRLNSACFSLQALTLNEIKAKLDIVLFDKTRFEVSDDALENYQISLLYEIQELLMCLYVNHIDEKTMKKTFKIYSDFIIKEYSSQIKNKAKLSAYWKNITFFNKSFFYGLDSNSTKTLEDIIYG